MTPAVLQRKLRESRERFRFSEGQVNALVMLRGELVEAGAPAFVLDVLANELAAREQSVDVERHILEWLTRKVRGRRRDKPGKAPSGPVPAFPAPSALVVPLEPEKPATRRPRAKRARVDAANIPGTCEASETFDGTGLLLDSKPGTTRRGLEALSRELAGDPMLGRALAWREVMGKPTK